MEIASPAIGDYVFPDCPSRLEIDVHRYRSLLGVERAFVGMPDGLLAWRDQRRIFGREYGSGLSEEPAVRVFGMAEELSLDVELPVALEALGTGWFEYGLVERAYATRRPEDFARMVAQWGHTAQSPRQYSVSS